MIISSYIGLKKMLIHLFLFTSSCSYKKIQSNSWLA